jgi:hypothetical protein
MLLLLLKIALPENNLANMWVKIINLLRFIFFVIQSSISSSSDHWVPPWTYVEFQENSNNSSPS